VSKISLEFNTKLYGGHRGARYVAYYTSTWHHSFLRLGLQQRIPIHGGILRGRG
jgi:hypothetical protein